MKGQIIAAKSVEECKRKWLSPRPLLIALVSLAAFTLFPSVLLFTPWAFERYIEGPGAVLLVTAHPDDETVFFGPTITSLRRNGVEVFLLCLTRGNARGLGELRTRELAGASSALQIDTEHLRIENNEERLPDSKIVDWDLLYAQKLIHEEVQSHNINTIITFDRGGITGHKNHKSCWQAVRAYASHCQGSRCPIAWSVLTKGKHQYKGVFESPPSQKKHPKHRTAVYLNRSIWRVFWAMHYHASQWRWWSHVLFTRYTYVNSLQTIYSKPTASKGLKGTL